MRENFQYLGKYFEDRLTKGAFRILERLGTIFAVIEYLTDTLFKTLGNVLLCFKVELEKSAKFKL